MIQFRVENVYQTCLTLRLILFDKLIKDAYIFRFFAFFAIEMLRKNDPEAGPCSQEMSASPVPGRGTMTAHVLAAQTCGGVCVKKTRYHNLRKKKSMEH